MGLTDTYCDWYASLAPEAAKELALFLMRLFPGGLLEPTLATPDPTDGFLPRVRRLPGRRAVQDAGTCLTLAALTDFIFESRADPARWAEDRERLEVLDQGLAALGDEGHADIAEWVAENRLRYPLRAKMWAKAHESWQIIRAGPLSDNEIRTIVHRLPMTD